MHWPTEPPMERRTGCLVLTHVADVSHGYATWKFGLRRVPFHPCDPIWT
jgi:hypothetical protein